MGTLFVRERNKVGKGSGKPRFAIVAVADLDLKVYHSHIRRLELETLAEALSAEVVYLPRGEQLAEHATGKQKRRKKAKNQD
jgi:hypothetical protein